VPVQDLDGFRCFNEMPGVKFETLADVRELAQIVHHGRTCPNDLSFSTKEGTYLPLHFCERGVQIVSGAVASDNPDHFAVISQHVGEIHEIGTKLAAKHILGRSIDAQVAEGPPDNQDAEIVRYADASKICCLTRTNQIKVA
jgi:hypothetical protein